MRDDEVPDGCVLGGSSEGMRASKGRDESAHGRARSFSNSPNAFTSSHNCPHRLISVTLSHSTLCHSSTAAHGVAHYITHRSARGACRREYAPRQPHLSLSLVPKLTFTLATRSVPHAGAAGARSQGTSLLPAKRGSTTKCRKLARAVLLPRPRLCSYRYRFVFHSLAPLSLTDPRTRQASTSSRLRRFARFFQRRRRTVRPTPRRCSASTRSATSGAAPSPSCAWPTARAGWLRALQAVAWLVGT